MVRQSQCSKDLIRPVLLREGRSRRSFHWFDPLRYARTPPPARPHIVFTSSGWFILGITIILFFQRMAALFSPVPRRGEYVKWGLVLYTTVMFLLVTVFTAPNLKILSISYIDNRRFPGVQGVLPPGVYGQIDHCSQGAQYHLYHHVRLEQLVSQRSFGQFFV